MQRALTAAFAAAAIGCAAPAAAAVTFTGTSGNLAASVAFSLLPGNTLQVVLTNTSSSDVNDNAQVLQAVFFNITGTPVLTYSDANLTAGSTFVPASGVLGTGTDVAAEWGYKQSSTGLGQGVTQDYGLSSAGYSIFGPANVLTGPTHPDRGGNSSPPGGGDFGLVSAGYSPLGNTNGFNNQAPHIDNSVTFLLTGFTGSLSQISGIRFQYGTATSDTSITGRPGPVPEPATWAMMLLGFGGIGIALRRRRSDARLPQIA